MVFVSDAKLTEAVFLVRLETSWEQSKARRIRDNHYETRSLLVPSTTKNTATSASFATALTLDANKDNRSIRLLRVLKRQAKTY